MRLIKKVGAALVLAAGLLAAPAAHAFSDVNAGIYGVVDQKGQPTDIAYRFYLQGGKWIAEERGKDGSWSAFTGCKSECEVHELNQVELTRWFGKGLDAMTPACIGNSNFAMCSYATKAQPPLTGYLMMVSTPKGPALLHVTFLSGV